MYLALLHLIPANAALPAVCEGPVANVSEAGQVTFRSAEYQRHYAQYQQVIAPHGESAVPIEKHRKFWKGLFTRAVAARAEQRGGAPARVTCTVVSETELQWTLQVDEAQYDLPRLDKIPGTTKVPNNLASPIVLSTADTPALTSPFVFGPRFDLDADGRSEAVGWVKPGAALLAYDRDANGRIDDGSELFGTATIVDGVPAENGYAAMAALDANGDGVLDPRDPLFAELQVWQDDGDARTEPGELVSLAEFGVTRLAVGFETVADPFHPSGNEVRLQSGWMGSACPSGCRSWDVWFAYAPTRQMAAH